MASSRLHFPKWNPRGALFFLAKTALLLARGIASRAGVYARAIHHHVGRHGSGYGTSVGLVIFTGMYRGFAVVRCATSAPAAGFACGDWVCQLAWAARVVCCWIGRERSWFAWKVTACCTFPRWFPAGMSRSSGRRWTIRGRVCLKEASPVGYCTGSIRRTAPSFWSVKTYNKPVRSLPHVPNALAQFASAAIRGAAPPSSR